MTISLCLMVRNEEAALPGCLQSIAGIADEIVVVDTGSTDRTKEVAAGFGAKVFDFSWCDDFAAARNECIRRATGEWIFWMDADERVDAVNREKLRALFDQLRAVSSQSSVVSSKKKEDSGQLSVVSSQQAENDELRTTDYGPLTNAAFVMKCLCVQPGESVHARPPHPGPLPRGAREEEAAPRRGARGIVGGTVVDHVRLFRNRAEHRWRYRVHEQILPALKSTGVDMRWTDIAIHHVGYQDALTTRRKLERNLRLLQLDHAEHPDEPYILFNLGWAHLELGNGQESGVRNQESGAEAPSPPSRCPGALPPGARGASEAIPLLQRSLQLSHPSDSIVKKTWALLATAHQRLGQIDLALAACRMGRARYPGDPELLFREGQLLAGTGNIDGAIGCFQRLVSSQWSVVSGQDRSQESGDRGQKEERDGLLTTDYGPLTKSFGSVEVGYTGYLARHELALLYHRKGDERRGGSAVARGGRRTAGAPARLARSRRAVSGPGEVGATGRGHPAHDYGGRWSVVSGQWRQGSQWSVVSGQ